jgi:5'-3' exonuclease|tara:strand:+ start:550 stop:1578 length:1029 start_codon:yes stop_codon:yes gene_type:complete
MATFYQFVYRGVHNMATYILVDTANTFFRARHVVRGDLDTKVGMALHITLAGVKKAWQDFNADHVVFCLEGRSWRKDFYLPYKRNRQVARDKMTVVESEEDTAFWEIFDEFKNFVTEKTNCTVMRHSQLEADDLIAGWVQAHPNDNHVIISTDGDFAQLIAPNCKQYNGIQDITITHEGYFDKKGNHVIDKKTKEAKPAPHPDFMLFEKCMRGDTSDNVFSAYPGVRKKGTKNKVGLIEAYDDKSNKGFNWNNMMLQRWTDHEGAEHRVLDDYQRNVVLCDLTAQPKEIRDIINETIDENAKPKQVQQVGMRLMKFCAKWDMQRIADQAQYFAEPLNAKYPE